MQRKVFKNHFWFRMNQAPLHKYLRGTNQHTSKHLAAASIPIKLIKTMIMAPLQLRAGWRYLQPLDGQSAGHLCFPASLCSIQTLIQTTKMFALLQDGWEVELEMNPREVWSFTITDKVPNRAFSWLKVPKYHGLMLVLRFVSKMNVKVLVGIFNQRRPYSRGILHDCDAEMFAKVRFKWGVGYHHLHSLRLVTRLSLCLHQADAGDWWRLG